MEHSDSPDRRHLTRHAVHTAIALSDGTRGTTTDISATGVRFACEGPHLAPGSEVVFRLTIGSEQMVLNCTGKVVRVEASGGKTFIAATINNVEFDIEGKSH